MSIFVAPNQARYRLSKSNSAFVTQLAMVGKTRDLVTAVALAIAVNRFADLPGGSIDSPEEYFQQQAGLNAADAINIINEMVPVDYKTALETAKDLYLIRYELAQRPFSAFGYDLSKGIAAIFGLNNHLPPNILDCIRHHGAELTNRANRFHEIITELKKD